MKRRQACWGALGWATVALSGCALPRTRTNAHNDDDKHWTGRLSLQVASDPPQSFSADFELRGSAQAGELRLSTLLGQTLATARWTPDNADLQTPQGSQVYSSMDALTQHLLGTALPLPPLFDWLRGTPTPADGWSADLSRHAEGRLMARRMHPQPAATLRLVLQ